MSWKIVTPRKEHTCECCSTEIHKKEQCYVETEYKEGAMYPQTTYYCFPCGKHVKQGKSFNETRKLVAEEKETPK